MNTKVKELLSNTLLFTVANLGSKLMVFLMVPLYTAVLSTDEYGIVLDVQEADDNESGSAIMEDYSYYQKQLVNIFCSLYLPESHIVHSRFHF